MKRYDLIVVGGGFAGTCAAIEAARNGLDVLLVEKYNCLGGAAANCLVFPFMKYWSIHPETNERIILTGNIFTEIIAELDGSIYLSADKQDFDEEMLKLILNRMCVKYGVNLLFNTTVVEANMTDGNITSIKAWGKSKMLELSADYFIDATGDGELSFLAGCEYQLGRSGDNLCQPMTLCFRIDGIDKAKWAANRGKINALYREFQEKGLIKNPRENVLCFDTLHDGIVHFNTTRIVKLNPTDPFDVTKAEIEAREQAYEVFTFLKENIEGFEKSRILSTALQIGIRESRMIKGEYTLTEDDLLSLARFDDAIAVANYDIDIHSPDGSGTSHHYFKKGEWYQIPYRCLLPKGISNMLVAGRCISATHEAQASIRIMPYVAEIGHAAGAAVSMAVLKGTTLKGFNIKELQAKLKEEGFVL